MMEPYTLEIALIQYFLFSAFVIPLLKKVYAHGN